MTLHELIETLVRAWIMLPQGPDETRVGDLIRALRRAEEEGAE